MAIIAPRLQQLLDEHHICYETLPHATDFTAQETSEHTGTPGRAVAKAVVVETGGRAVMLVLPAAHAVEFARLEMVLQERRVDLVREGRLRRIFRDCDRGAIPPFGNLYGLEVLATPRLLRNATLTFNAGSHEMAIRLSAGDYEDLVRPRTEEFSSHI